MTAKELVVAYYRRPPVTIIDNAIHFLREAWRDDGAEGESVHLICREAEALRTERDEAWKKVEEWQAATDRMRALGLKAEQERDAAREQLAGLTEELAQARAIADAWKALAQVRPRASVSAEGPALVRLCASGVDPEASS